MDTVQPALSLPILAITGQDALSALNNVKEKGVKLRHTIKLLKPYGQHVHFE